VVVVVVSVRVVRVVLDVCELLVCVEVSDVAVMVLTDVCEVLD
jgi:hypothetical protein